MGISTVRNGRDERGRFVFGNDFTKNIGRPKLWETPEEMLESFGEYIIWNEQEENQKKIIEFNGSKAVRCEVPKERGTTIRGFARFCNTYDNIFYLYEKLDGFSQICAYIRNYCSANLIEGAMAGTLHPIIVSRLEGLVDKKEIKTENIQTVFFEVPQQIQLESPSIDAIEGEDWELI